MSPNIHDQHAVVLDESAGLDPTKMYLDALDERRATKDAEQAEKKKLYSDAWTTVEGLEAEGWYKHDNARQEKRDNMRGKLAEWYSEYGMDVFSGKEGKARQTEFRNMKSDYDKFEVYSKQLQEEYSAGAKQIQANPDKYDSQSSEQFLAWKELPYDEQIKRGMPQLKTKEEATNWMMDLKNYGVDGFTNQFGSTKIKPGKGVITSQSGVSIKEDDIKEWSINWVRTGLNPSSGNKGGKAVFDQYLWELTGDKGRLRKEGDLLDNEERGEDGYTELERRAFDLAVEAVSDFQKRRIKTSYEYSESQLSGSGEGKEGGATFPTEASSTINNSQMQPATITNVTYVSQTGGGASDPRVFNISPTSVFHVDKGTTYDINTTFAFSPVRVFNADVFTKKTTVGGKTYKKGDIVPDEISGQVTNKKNERLVEGIRLKKGETGDVLKTVTTEERTYWVRESQIKGSMKKHIEGYGESGGGSEEVESSVFETGDDDKGI
jgi:hypothetical protein